MRGPLGVSFACALALAACGDDAAFEAIDADLTLDGVDGVIDAATVDGAMARPIPYRGVNLSGAEFGDDGGTFGQQYTYPDPMYAGAGYQSADYFLAKGMTTFRVPFRWEHLQPQLNGALDAAELERLTTTVAHLTAKHAYVLIDPHNYARYRGQVIGSAGVPHTAFADLWTRLATAFKDNDHVIFGLMNEPNGEPTEQWRDSANAGIAAIRAAGAHNLITVPGNAYTGAHSWADSWYGTPNAEVMLTITDPEDHFVFEVHQYLDSDSSGTNGECVSETRGAEVMQTFTAWARAHGKHALVGELGASDNARCLAAIDSLLDHVDANPDVYVGWTWWSAGPWWGSYFMSVEPRATGDAPQLGVLAEHL